jgi:formate dehydrogenase subunit delta
MNIERLITMANDIAAAFSAEPDREEAIAAIAAHLERFWDPAMRAQIKAYCTDGGAALDRATAEAIARLP